MKLLCLLFVGLASASAQANDEQYVKITKLKDLNCKVIYLPSRMPQFQVIDGWTQTIVAVTTTPTQGTKLVSKCKAAIYQAQQEEKAIFINFETGDVVPEDGFFTRPSK